MNMLDNGIWWLPDAECIDRKESCTCYVRYVGVGGYDPAADSANKKSSELRFVESGICYYVGLPTWTKSDSASIRVEPLQEASLWRLR